MAKESRNDKRKARHSRDIHPHGNVPNPCSLWIFPGLPHIGMMGYYCHFQPFSVLKGMATRAKNAILLTMAYLSDDEL